MIDPKDFRRRIGEAKTDEDWLSIHADMIAYEESNPSKEDLNRYVPWGLREYVDMHYLCIIEKNKHLLN